MSKYTEKIDKVAAMKSIYDRQRNTILMAEQKKAMIEESLQGLDIKIDNLNGSITALKELSDKLNENVRKELEETINLGLRKAFPGDNYELTIRNYNHGQTKMTEFRVREAADRRFKKLASHGNAISMIISLLTLSILVASSDGLKFIAIDEALSGLDDDRVAIILEIVASFSKKFGLTFIIIEHGSFSKYASDYENIEIIPVKQSRKGLVVEV